MVWCFFNDFLFVIKDDDYFLLSLNQTIDIVYEFILNGPFFADIDMWKKVQVS